ncbi:sulfite exporter TauE/SafE family protein [Streptomyces sp. JV176]|uniref:sulfite exporter TauE/SafE family protein n=1 Tax=Streptomyces sp. JV176 TaxID=858630 RepID=UPI002E77AB0E|nr:sulfite exporter TauE/SafE family protein [Streptomyces sp. JV176]MEE1799453.1 sulfite exporter TauE/SafE family protein [Streptomyces sp. JV176]
MSALILALICGAVVGLALGALGGGGSVLAVPALIYLLGFTPAAATTAGLIIVTATSLTALYAHARGGTVRWRAGALFAAAGLLPAAAAGAAASRLPQPVLTAAFAGVAALAAVRMLCPSRASTGRTPGVRPVKAAGTGAGLGALTGLLGVGGGFLAVPALVTVLAFEMRAAVGTSLLVISANSLASLATRGATTAGIDWAVVGPFTGAAILGVRDGRRLAAKVTGLLLQRTFAVVLLAVAAFMLVDGLT